MPTKKAAKAKYPKKAKELIALLNLRVDAGVRYLDKKMGRDAWLDKIDERQLDLGDSHACVCGQLFESFWSHVYDEAGKQRSTTTAAEEEILVAKHAVKYGFYLEDELYNIVGGYDMLTRLWFIRVSMLRMERGMDVKTPPPFN